MKKVYGIVIFCFVVATAIIASRMAGGSASGSAQNANNANTPTVTPAQEKAAAAMTTEQLFESIMSSPSYSSNTKDYLDAHEAEHRQLLANKERTLKYIFSQFIKGSEGSEPENGLKGVIMCIVLNELAPESTLDLAATPQEYFNAWKDAALKLKEGHDDSWMQANYPAAQMLLQTLAKK